VTKLEKPTKRETDFSPISEEEDALGWPNKTSKKRPRTKNPRWLTLLEGIGLAS